MNYEEATAYMQKVQKKGSILGLEPVKMLLALCKNPQETQKVIHVAGTNGKGSISTFLEVMYRAEGKKVGRYISPTLYDYLERFQIDGVNMPKEVFAELLTEVAEKIDQMEEAGYALPTAFEIETVIMFLYFQKENVDLIILETGMGGREDATNVVSKPLCTIFSSIGMDHMQFLGNTLEEITYQKAGIIKDNCPVVSYPNKEEVMQVLNQEADLHNTRVKQIKKEEIEIISETLEESIFLYQGEQYTIKLLGEYQIYNAVTAIVAKQLLDGKLKKESLLEAKWKGRFERISTDPLFIRDGAHNVDGVNALKISLQKHFTNTKILFIIGVLKDKEYRQMMEILCPLATRIWTITPGNERGLSAQELKQVILPYCKNTSECGSLEEAVTLAKQEYQKISKTGEAPVIVAWGSLSYLGEIKV